MKRLALVVLSLAFTTTVLLAQAPRVTVTFAPQKKNHAFDAAVDEYRQIWAAEGTRMIEAMERIVTLKFPEKAVKVEVFEGPSSAGIKINRDGTPGGLAGPMLLRASYRPDEKKGTLVHELGHRMDVQLKKRPKDLDEHRVLFLYLYDLYVDLYGKEFADKEVAFGKTLKGLYDYETAWNWALAMSREERLARFREVLALNQK